MKPIYLYGIIPSDHKIIFDEVCGMDDEEDEVYAYPVNGIAAVVGSSPLDDYRGLKRDRVMRYLVIHQRVVEAVMNHFTVLPVKFGTVLPDLGSLERLLYRGTGQFAQALKKLHGLVQMEVVMLWNLQRVFQEIGQDDAVMQLKAHVAQRPAEQTVNERVALGQLVKQMLEQRRAELAGHVGPQLCALARDSIVNPILDDSIVINQGLLLDAPGRQALDATLDHMDEAFNGRYTFRRVGPLPPYSFATVEVQVPTFEATDAARQMLGCDALVSLEEIRRAYYLAAKQLHPDLNAGDKEKEARMTTLAQAYKLLTQVAENQMLGQGGEHPPTAEVRCHLDRASIESMLLIAVRRQEVNSDNGMEGMTK
jgi:hypothetical protein